MTIESGRTALLLMDFEPVILGAYGDTLHDLIARTQAVALKARERGIQIAYARLGFTDANYAEIPSRNKVFAQAGQMRAFDADDPNTQIIHELAPRPGDIVVRKYRFGAFSTTDLDDQFKQRGIDTLVLAGVATSGIVLSTVRDAADKDYRLYVLSDCCADRDPEVHRVLTEKVFPRQADVITSEDFLTA